MKEYLKGHTKEEIAEVVNCRTDGSTPLLVASRNGMTLMVKYLIMECGADTELAGKGIYIYVLDLYNTNLKRNVTINI